MQFYFLCCKILWLSPGQARPRPGQDRAGPSNGRTGPGQGRAGTGPDRDQAGTGPGSGRDGTEPGPDRVAQAHDVGGDGPGGPDLGQGAFAQGIDLDHGAVDPYGDGWMVVLEVDDPSSLDGLLSAQAYGELTEDA